MTIKILAALGDFYHNESMCRQALDSAVRQLDGHIKVEYIHEKDLIQELQGNPDAVILFKGNKLNPTDPQTLVWMGDEEASIISKYVENGGSWFAWHSGLASYEVNTYINMLKGYFEYHPEMSQVKYSADSQNDVTDPNLEYEIIDEHYFIDCDVEGTNIFLRSESKDGKSAAGWAHHYGEGRVLCLTPAHTEEALLHPKTIQLVSDSIKWCLSE
ncbi:ThuA domain-containing protein [Bacillus sp. FJAT-49711]|uniref:ThuA domain-containing protein n=1 Tax=Bacillus sp. FJAT-49711 TaxID=2833585 RepID=UPI001BC8CE34|nr:ThuA domain-containing protein [Bacillus sp. FJAT-49711]MBS4218632.1 ThuA domain-containing protein [Bacillus sp. FJAT-49711]